jgi:hypothetical protein
MAGAAVVAWWRARSAKKRNVLERLDLGQAKVRSDGGPCAPEPGGGSQAASCFACRRGARRWGRRAGRRPPLDAAGIARAHAVPPPSCSQSPLPCARAQARTTAMNDLCSRLEATLQVRAEFPASHAWPHLPAHALPWRLPPRPQLSCGSMCTTLANCAHRARQDVTLLTTHPAAWPAGQGGRRGPAPPERRE